MSDLIMIDPHPKPHLVCTKQVDKTKPQHYNIVSHAEVAQPVEQRTENPCVAGSIPALGTTNGK
jgi:hypothetical protein